MCCVPDGTVDRVEIGRKRGEHARQSSLDARDAAQALLLEEPQVVRADVDGHQPRARMREQKAGGKVKLRPAIRDVEWEEVAEQTAAIVRPRQRDEAATGLSRARGVGEVLVRQLGNGARVANKVVRVAAK